MVCQESDSSFTLHEGEQHSYRMMGRFLQVSGLIGRLHNDCLARTKTTLSQWKTIHGRTPVHFMLWLLFNLLVSVWVYICSAFISSDATTSVEPDSVQDAPSGKAETPWKFGVSASTFNPAKFVLRQPLDQHNTKLTACYSSRRFSLNINSKTRCTSRGIS